MTSPLTSQHDVRALSDRPRRQRTVKIYGYSIAHPYGEPHPGAALKRVVERPDGMVLIYGRNIRHFYHLQTSRHA